jgi:hypothetical protein
MQLESLKTLALATSLAMVAGGGTADLLAPGFLRWYNMPGGGDAMCHCVDLVRATTDSFLKAQLVGSASGGVIGFLLGLLILRRGKAQPLQIPG